MGWLNITNTVAVGGPGPGLMLQNKGAGGVPINVVDTVLEDVAQNGPLPLPPHVNAPVLLTTKMELGHQYCETEHLTALCSLLRLIIHALRADALGGVSFSNLTVRYGDATARFASSMPWLSVAAGQPVTQSGKPVADPKAAAEIQQVRAPLRFSQSPPRACDLNSGDGCRCGSSQAT